jgi:TolB-like protein
MLLLAVAAVAWAETPSPADSSLKKPSRITLAVKNLEARGVSEDEAATLSDVLRSQLINTGNFSVMERAQMDEILKEQAFQQSGACTEEACLVQMGQLLGIQVIAAGSIGKIGRAYSINARTISVQTGEILTTVSRTYSGPIEKLLTDEIAVVALELAGKKADTSRRAKTNKRGMLIIAGAGLGAGVAAGAAVYFVLQNKKKTPDTGEAQISWSAW